MDEYRGMALLYKMRRLNPLDEIPEIVDKLAENSVGAMEFVLIMLKSGKVTELVACDNLGLYGKNLYMFWNDCCQRDLNKVCNILKQYMENKITKSYILKHLNEFHGEKINLRNEV